MALAHTPARTTEHPDTFVDDETGREYSVYQDLDAEDPRTCIDTAHAALWAYRQPALGSSYVADFPEGNWILDAFKRFYDFSDSYDGDEALDMTRRWLRIFHPEDADGHSIEIATIRGYSQSDWLDVVCVTAEGYGSPALLMKEVRMWAWGDVWAVESDHGDLVSGIYADSAEEALGYYRRDHEDPSESPKTPEPEITDFFVDGHHVTANSATEAAEEARSLYSYVPEVVRPWTALDTERAAVPPAFAPDSEPDRFRDLWNENMPRVSGRMYFSVPGEQPIHVDDGIARTVLAMLSEQERGLR